MNLFNSELPIKFGRIIYRETVITPQTGILIAAPYDETGFKAAEKIRDRFEFIQCKAKVLHDPEYIAIQDCKSPVIVIGNLANSRCVKHLYYKFLCVTDKSYPGSGGYTLHTILDPFGNGCNIIHIGYSDKKGLEYAIEAFLKKASNPIPYCNDVSCMKLPYDEKFIERVKNSPVPEKSELIPSIHTSYWWLMGYISYMTGEKEPLAKYLEGWRKMLELSEKDIAIEKNTHLYMMTHIEMWRFLDYAGMIPDDIKGKIEKCIFNWAESREGKGYAVNSTGKMLPSHNHSMFCALSLLYAADFFKIHYPDIREPDEWLRIAHDVFYTFNNGGWKPYCDDSAYSSQVTLPLVCMYSIFEDNHKFLENSGRKAADWIKAVIGQNSFIPSFGDGTVSNPFPASLIRILAHYLKDGELKYMHDLILDERNNTLGLCTHRLFDSGVEPVKLSEPSAITVVPMDKYIYNSWDKDSNEGKRLTMTPPEGPYEKCFDKISIRTGWKEEDEFLLIDGLGSNGIHSYSDAMGILDYTCKGIVWLVEENSYRWPEPENCSILTITRNGYASDIPGFALVEDKKIINDDNVYLRLRSKNYNGVDWVREVFLIKGLCVVFHDTVIANENGEYTICTHFRTPGKAWLEGNTMKSIRENGKGSKYELRLSGYGPMDISREIDEIPVGKVLFSYGGINNKDNKFNYSVNAAELGKKMWRKRYNDSNMVISAMTACTSSYLNKGEDIYLTHIVHPAKHDDSDIKISYFKNRIQLQYTEKTFEFPTVDFGAIHVIYQKKASMDEDFASKNLDLRKEVVFPKKITGIARVSANTDTCILEGGKLLLLNNGDIQWEKDLAGDIHAVEHVKHDKEILLIGSGNNKLSAIDINGNTLWETQIQRIPTIFESWEMPHPQVVKIKHICTDDRAMIAVGCGDNQMRIYDMTGRLLNAFYIYATVPDIIEFVDIDGDGKLELLAAGKKESSQGTFYVHDMEGKPGQNINVGGWLCNIKSHVISHLNGKTTIICGMNYGTNFKIMEAVNGQLQNVSEKSLGGTVCSICLNEETGTIFVGTSKGFILSFDKFGRHLWSTCVNDIVQNIFHIGSGIIAICKGGNIYKLSSEGKALGSCSLPAKPECCIKDADKIMVGCGNVLYSLLVSPKFRK